MNAGGATLPRPARRRCRDCDKCFTTNDLNVVCCYRCRVVAPPARARSTGSDRDDILFLMEQVADLQRWKTVLLTQVNGLERRCRKQQAELSANNRRLRKVRDFDLPPAPPVVGRTLEEVRNAICTAFDIPAVYLCSRRRTAFCAKARHAFILLATERTFHTLGTVAQAVGLRDHTSAIHGLARAQQHEAGDPKFAKCLAKAREALDDA